MHPHQPRTSTGTGGLHLRLGLCQVIDEFLTSANCKSMFQLLYIDVAKADRDVAYIVMAYVLSVCSKCFIYSRSILQVFYLNVVKVDLDIACTCMLQAYIFKCFIRM